MNTTSMKKLYIRYSLVSIAIFALMTIVSFFFLEHSSDPTLNIAMLYTVGIFFVTRYTKGMLYGMIFSFAAVFSVNFFFTYPYGKFNFSIEGYQVAFLGMLLISVIASAMSYKIKTQGEKLLEQEKEISRQAKMVMDGEKEKMRANLLRAVSHDLRTPLTGILGNTETFLEMYEELDDDERKQLVKGVNDDADWLLNMVENLLAVTRIDNDTATVKKTSEAVDEVVSSAIIKFKKRFPNVSVKVSVPEEFVMADMDAILIQQVIINILQNGAMHSKTQKPIELRVVESDSTVDFYIRDYGVGIEESKLSSIFDASGSGPKKSATDGYKGMGIGLSICKTIILAHGGNICAHNLDEGAEFVFYLPK